MKNILIFFAIINLVIISFISGCIEEDEPDLFRIDEIFSANDVLGFHCFSHDGSKVIFSTYYQSPKNSTDLWIMNIDGTQKELLYQQNNSIRDVQYSPNVDEIIFVEHDGTSKILSLNVQSKDTKELASGLDPQISPSGEKIVYVHNSEIWMIDFDGRNEELIAEHGDTPLFFPLEDKILFRETKGSICLSIMNLDGSNKEVLFSSDNRIYAISISPTGTHLLFNSEYEYGGSYLSSTTWLYEIFTGDLTQLDEKNEFQYSFAFHPIYPILTYTNKEKMTQNTPIEICVRNYEGDKVKFISKDGMDYRSTFSPDGTKIAFHHRDWLGDEVKLCIANDDTGKWEIIID